MLEPIDEVLTNLRRVIRATDLHSRQLSKKSGLTAPQLLVMVTIQKHPEYTISEIAKEISLSQATVTTIVDRLEKRELLHRVRSDVDRRRVHPQLTESGKKLIAAAPTALQDSFVEQFEQLEDWEQAYLVAALKRVAQMMDAERIDASPLLHVGDIDTRAQEADEPAANS